MSASFPRRPHLAERAIEAARAAAAADSPLIRAPRLPIAPGNAGMPGAAPPAAEFLPPALPRSQASGPPGREEPAPIPRALLQRAGLVGEAGNAREEIALVREQVLRTVEATAGTKDRAARMVVVTSARPGEGKSFTALNLAASVAEGARRPAILVDTEGGAGSLTAQLGAADAPGLEQLRGTGGPDPATLLLRTEIPDLFLLPRGAAAPAGTPGGAMAAALLRLAGRLPAHLLVLDTPACLEASAAGLLAAAAGQVVVVVEAERTTRSEVEAALDILDACPQLQLMLNKAALRVSDRFGERALRENDASASAEA